MNYVKTVINIALKEDGYLEKASNKSLDSKKANAGRANYTKYARDLDAIPGFYNGVKQGYPWCDVFVDWCFVKAFGADNAKKLLCQPSKSLGAGCGYSLNYYRQHGQLYLFYPKVGDQIFFGTESSVDHTGLVYKVDSKYVYTIEGNTSSEPGVVDNGGCVRKKKYLIGYDKIVGYGRPEYDEEVIKVKVSLSVLKKGSKGEEVKTLQRLLMALGYSLEHYGADGSFGGVTERAVKAFQTDKKIAIDGSVGKETWVKILGVN